MEEKWRNETREKRVYPNPMGELSLLEKCFNCGKVEHFKREMILIMSLKNIFRRMVEIPLL